MIDYYDDWLNMTIDHYDNGLLWWLIITMIDYYDHYDVMVMIIMITKEDSIEQFELVVPDIEKLTPCSLLRSAEWSRLESLALVSGMPLVVEVIVTSVLSRNTASDVIATCASTVPVTFYFIFCLHHILQVDQVSVIAVSSSSSSTLVPGWDSIQCQRPGRMVNRRLRGLENIYWWKVFWWNIRKDFSPF